MGLLHDSKITTAVAVIVTVYLVGIIYRTVQWRKRCSRLPGPPHHPVLGHMMVMGELMSQLPKRVHGHVHAHFLREKYDLPQVFCLDTFPITVPMLVILDPDIAEEVTNSGLLKHSMLKEVIGPLAGPENLLVSEGDMWKKWRKVFNPGFSAQHIMSQVPMIVDCAVEFAAILDKHAVQGRLFRMEEETTKITVDVMGKAICGHDFGLLQSNDNEFVKALKSQLSWMPDVQRINPFYTHNPLRAIMSRFYKNKMDRYIGRILDERFSAQSRTEAIKKKTAIDLALSEYSKEKGESTGLGMDAEFRQNAIDNLLVLIFAGHDTTASTICYCYHLLSKHPDVLQKLRQELDRVFGPGNDAAEQLRHNPYLINDCEFTLAVIKETLRLWPPASTVRAGRKDFFVKNPVTGDMFPTDGFMIFNADIALQRDPRNFEDAQLFKPERFLPDNADKLRPNAFRPFEKGPRACIGQELALVEMKIVLALTVREFDVRTALDEVSSLKDDKTIWTTIEGKDDGPQECFGDELYQVLLASAKPREGMPARVSRTTKS